MKEYNDMIATNSKTARDEPVLYEYGLVKEMFETSRCQSGSVFKSSNMASTETLLLKQSSPLHNEAWAQVF